jgi:Domain of unknown function (DUF4262)
MTEPTHAHLYDALLAHQHRLIRNCGRAITYVSPKPGEDTPSFGYTIGLTERGDGFPEFVIAGLNPHITADLLNDLADRVLTHGTRFEHGQTLSDLIIGHPAVILAGPVTDDLYPGTAIARYGTDAVTLQQIVWPDPTGRFPWDDGYAYPSFVQSVLGRP